MKHFVRTCALGSLLVLLSTGMASAQPRLATIDLKKIFDGYWKTKQASEQIQGRRTEMEKEDKNMIDDYKKMKDDYDKLLKDANDQSVAPDERDRRKKAAEEKFKALKDQEDGIAQYERTSRTTLMELQDRMRSNILNDIRTLVSSKSKSAGFSLVLDTAALSAAGTPVVLFSNNESDLTDAVLTQLNANAPADTPKADDNLTLPKQDNKKADGKK